MFEIASVFGGITAIVFNAFSLIGIFLLLILMYNAILALRKYLRS